MASRHSSLTSLAQPFAYVLVACLTLLAITIAGVEMLYHKNLKTPLARVVALQDESLETYLADIEFLNRSELAISLNGGDATAQDVDAGPFLNAALFWNSATFGRAVPLVPAKSREFLMRYEDDWIKGRTFLEKGNIKADLSIFNELEKFHFWDLEKNSPLQKIAESGAFILPSQQPAPETLDLITAVKVRLMKGSIDGNPVRALKDVRKFALLLLTTENYQLVMTGLAALDLERRAYREYVDRDWLDPAIWLPIDQNASMRAGRAFTATTGYLRALTPETTFNKVFNDKRVPPGFCAAANEQLPVEFAFRSKLTGWWPLEREYHQGFKRLDRALELASKHCRLRILRKLHAEDGFKGINPDGPWPLTYIPYFRTLFALRDWAAWPMHFDGYQRR